jgi:hypothetical protein
VSAEVVDLKLSDVKGGALTDFIPYSGAYASEPRKDRITKLLCQSPDFSTPRRVLPHEISY